MQSESRQLLDESAAFWATVSTLGTMTGAKSKRVFLTDCFVRNKYLKKWFKVLLQDKGYEFIEYAKELDVVFEKEIRLVLKKRWTIYDVIQDIGIDLINLALEKAELKPIEIEILPKRKQTLPDSKEDHLELWDHPDRDAPLKMTMGRIVLDGMPRADLHCLTSNVVTIMQSFKKLGLPVYYTGD